MRLTTTGVPPEFRIVPDGRVGPGEQGGGDPARRAPGRRGRGKRPGGRRDPARRGLKTRLPRGGGIFKFSKMVIW